MKDINLNISINAADLLSEITKVFPNGAMAGEPVMVESGGLYDRIKTAIESLAIKEWDAVSVDSELEYLDYISSRKLN